MPEEKWVPPIPPKADMERLGIITYGEPMVGHTVPVTEPIEVVEDDLSKSWEAMIVHNPKQVASQRVWITCHLPNNKRSGFQGEESIQSGFANMKEAVEALADAQRGGSHNKCGHSFGSMGHGKKRKPGG